MATSFSFPVVSFRKLETPFGKTNHRDYFAIVSTSDLPDLTKWRKINVRDPKLTGSVPRAIRKSAQENPDTFLFMNRGIVISVASVEFDNKESVVTVKMLDKDLHGLLDGGHTYKILRDVASELEQPQFVKLEILEGFNPEEILDIVDARNTSNQVRPQSLMNLEGAFDDLKAAIKGKSYATQIAYKEHELFDGSEPKPIDVREVVALLTVFDKSSFDQYTHPINAYRSKAACLTHFSEHRAAYKKIYPIADDILRLYDAIQLHLPDLYNEGRSARGDVTGGKFGKLTGVTAHERSKVQLLYSGENSAYSVPSGFVFPILGAFRALIVEKKGRYRWVNDIDPIELLTGEFGKALADTVGNFAREDRNPSKTGKSPLVWESCYKTGMLQYFQLTH